MKKLKKRIPVFDEMEIGRVPLSSVKLLKGNPRKNDNAAKSLAVLLSIHGQRSPVVVWKKDNQIYKGNTTYKALKIIGAKMIDVLWVDFKSKADAVAYNLADNKASEYSEWDDDILATLMQADDLQLTALATGFTEKELKALRLHTDDMPGVVPDVDIQGHIPGKSDFVVIQFESKNAMSDFKKRLGIKVETQRVIPFESMLKFMSWKSKEIKIRK